MEIRLLMIALNNVDLPTFGRPTTATNGLSIAYSFNKKYGKQRTVPRIFAFFFTSADGFILRQTLLPP